MRITLEDTELFYTKQGQGPDLILLHGNGENHEIFTQALPLIQTSFCVYCLDTRGHGRSQDTECFHYQEMANDLKQFVEALNLHKPIVYGFSDGAIIALLCEISHPETFSQLIFSGINLNPDQLTLDVKKEIEEEFAINPLPRLEMMLKQPWVTQEQCSKVKCPVVYLQAQRDVISLEKAKQNASLFSECEFVFIKDRGHGDYIVHSDEIALLILRYAKY